MQGLSYKKDFITARHEESLIKQIDNGLWYTDGSTRWQDFGYAFNSGRGIGMLPEWCSIVVDKTKDIVKQRFNQTSVYEMLPSQGAEYFEPEVPYDNIVMVLSLSGPMVINFQNVTDDTQPEGKIFRRLLEPRSLLVLSGPARFQYFRSFEATKIDVWKGEEVTRGRYIGVAFRNILDKNKQIDDELIFYLRATLGAKIGEIKHATDAQRNQH